MSMATIMVNYDGDDGVMMMTTMANISISSECAQRT